MRTLTLVLIAIVLACIAGCQHAQLTAAKPGESLPTRSSDAQYVTVELGQWFVNLKPSTIKAGETHFYVKNIGVTDHAFAINGIGVDEKTGTIATGQMIEAAIDLKAGSYFVSCPQEGHKDMGMVSELTVQDQP